MGIRPRDSAPGRQRTAGRVIFESDTRAGRAFDVVLLAGPGAPARC
ncbi:hypothetical protein [Hymenobacter daeguensis]